MLVHTLGVGAQRQDKQHVRQVDRLPPGRGTHLETRYVDHLHVRVHHEQVRGLDVAMAESLVPQAADEGDAAVDDGVAHLGVTQRLGVFEELGDEQVFTVGCELHDAVGPGNGEAIVVENAQGVVLVFDQPAHGGEPRLVL